MRRHLTFACEGDTLAGSLDEAAGETGLLIVSGGNELRCGAHRGMAMLAARLAGRGFPVFRFDRRGIGDSTGENRGFEHGGPDILAAADVFARETRLTRVVAFGNCDAATALWLIQPDALFHALVLANPWTSDPADPTTLPPPAAIRAHYRRKIGNPRELLRLLTGKVDLRKLTAGLVRARQRTGSALAGRMAATLPRLGCELTILVAARDHTAVAFRAALPGVPVVERDTASHSFAGEGDADWLLEQIARELG